MASLHKLLQVEWNYLYECTQRMLFLYLDTMTRIERVFPIGRVVLPIPRKLVTVSQTAETSGSSFAWALSDGPRVEGLPRSLSQWRLRHCAMICTLPTANARKPELESGSGYVKNLPLTLDVSVVFSSYFSFPHFLWSTTAWSWMSPRLTEKVTINQIPHPKIPQFQIPTLRCKNWYQAKHRLNWCYTKCQY